jgi:hypothetical protein
MSLSRSQHHFTLPCRSPTAVTRSGFGVLPPPPPPPPRRSHYSFHHLSPKCINRSPRSRSLPTKRAAPINQSSSHDKGELRDGSRPTRSVSNHELILIDGRGEQLPRGRSTYSCREVKESESESKSGIDKSSKNDTRSSPSRRKSSAQALENHHSTSHCRTSSRARSKSLLSHDADAAFSHASTANVPRLAASSRTFVKEISRPDLGYVPVKTSDKSASSKCRGSNSSDDTGYAQRETENRTTSPYSWSQPNKTRLRSSLRASSRDALGSSCLSLIGSRCNSSQASVSFAMDREDSFKNVANGDDSYYHRSIDTSANSRQSTISSMSDVALGISVRSSESNSHRSVRFPPDQKSDHQTPNSSDAPSPSINASDIHARPHCGQSSTTTVTSRDRSVSPRQVRRISDFVDFDPPASTATSHQSIDPSPPHHDVHLLIKGLISYKKASIHNSILTESTEETYSLSAITPERTILTDHTSRAVVEVDGITFSTLNLESGSTPDASILSESTAFMGKHLSTRRSAKYDGSIAQASKKESMIGMILEFSSSKGRDELKLNSTRETSETRSMDPNSLLSTQSGMTCHQNHASERGTQIRRSQKSHLHNYFRR